MTTLSRWAACGLVLLVCCASMGARWRCWNCGPCECSPCYCQPVESAKPQANIAQAAVAAPHSAISNRQSAIQPAGHAQAAADTPPAAKIESAPQVDSGAVRRRGDFVEHTTDIMAEADQALFAALAVPEDDNGKWFISVVTTQGCAPCNQLKAAWRVEPLLLAWADPANPKTSWAHYNEYGVEDKSQAFRWEGLQFRTFPTVILQPPRNGRYGDPATIVYGKPYPGSPKKLSEEMRRAMKAYIDRLPKQANLRAGLITPLGGHAWPAEGTIGVDPPWTPAPKNDPLGPYTPQPVDVPPANTPSVPSSEGAGWFSFLSIAVGALLGQLTHALPPLWRMLVQAAIASITQAAAAAQAKAPAKEE